MKNSKLSLSILEYKLAVCRLETNEQLPVWALKSPFFSITKTNDELSIVCIENSVPGNIKSEKDWRAFKVEDILSFSQTGVLASLTVPLAEAGINIFTVSTFNTDYILIKNKNLRKAIEVLGKFCNIVN